MREKRVEQNTLFNNKDAPFLLSTAMKLAFFLLAACMALAAAAPGDRLQIGVKVRERERGTKEARHRARAARARGPPIARPPPNSALLVVP